MLDIFTTLEDYGNYLHVKVTPKAAANYIKVVHQSDGTKLIKVYVTVAAESGKANREVVKLLSKELDIPPSRLQILKGHTSQNKLIKIQVE